MSVPDGFPMALRAANHVGVEMGLDAARMGACATETASSTEPGAKWHPDSIVRGKRDLLPDRLEGSLNGRQRQEQRKRSI